MFWFISKNLMRWLSILLFMGALFSIGMVAGPAFYYSGKSLEEAAFNRLSAINQIKKREIIRYLNEKIGDLKIHSESEYITKACKLLMSYHQSEGAESHHKPFDITSEEYKAIYQKIDPSFRHYADIYGYYDIFLLCKNGDVIYTITQKKDLGTNLQTGPFKDSGLAKIWANVIATGKPAMTDFSFYAPSNRPSFFLAAPVFDQKKEIIAVVGLQFITKEINIITQEKAGIGETEETYLAGDDLLMRSDSRFEKEPTTLKKKVSSAAVYSSDNIIKNIEIIKNYRDIKVITTYSYLGLKKELGTDFDWAIISEISETEAFKPIRSLQLKILVIGIFLLAFSGTIGYFLALSIARPLRALSNKAVSVANGDLTVTMSRVKRSDEIGVLINAFYYMMNTLRKETQQIIEGTNTLASSISQISATATELATNSAETSTLVNEITSTVEDIRQTAHLSHEKAEQVAKSAEDATRISETGKKATEDAITGMSRIREEMEYVAESIVKLSEQTQSIGEIISAVNDLADQSNLLSVNASIEAAKAGEHGKGFAVVAQEVKSLADQSKEATNQVRTILNEIQKATSAAVMATERGSKAVEAGVNMAVRLGDAIGTLSNSVMVSAKAAMQIAASSQEQLVGMDQLFHAMDNIKQASFQNVDGAKQLEIATKNLNDLGKKMKELILMFKV